MTEEIWKDIKAIHDHQAEWPFHQVSNLGRIRVLPSGVVGGSRKVRVTELRTLSRQSSGYMTIKHGKQTMYVHRIVLHAFVGPCPPGLECRHLSGNRSDNRWPENIKWGTKEENTEDRARHGMDLIGERNSQAKLTESEVLEIKDLLPHFSDKKLAKRYGVSYGTIWKIRSGRKWRHLTQREPDVKMAICPYCRDEVRDEDFLSHIEMHPVDDMRWRNCLDCGIRTDHMGEWYIVNENLWDSVVPEDKDPDGEYRGGFCLCVGCLEARLGRKLIEEDFTDCSLNSDEEGSRSTRLLDRMGIRKFVVNPEWETMANEWYQVHSIVTPENPNLYYVD
jgi:hypothetical protein